MTIRVILVDDHRLVREALSDALRGEADIEVVGEAGDAIQALALVPLARPDVAVLDVGLPGTSGIELASQLKALDRRIGIVALSAYTDRRFVNGMLKAGATAYIAKSAAGTELVRAIRSVAAGKGYFCSETSMTLADSLREGQRDENRLAPREREVLRLIASGKRSAEIAESLGIAVATVEVHRRNIMRKLGLHTVADLTRYAVREGLVLP